MNTGHIITFFAMFLMAGVLFGVLWGQDNLRAWKKDAFERGHMVQCLGKIGYHWECEK